MLTKVLLTTLLFAVPTLASAQQEKAFAKGSAHAAAPDKNGPAHTTGHASHNNGGAEHATAHASRGNGVAAQHSPASSGNTRHAMTPRSGDPIAHNGATAGPRATTTNHGVPMTHAPANKHPGTIRMEKARTVTRPDGSRAEYGRSGHVTSVTTRSGAIGHYDPNGHVTSIHAHGMTIHHGGNGARTYVTERPDHSRVVGYGGGRGYVERPYVREGHPYMRRTYVYGGRTYVSVYRGYGWHGRYYYGYVPHYYYGPRFYGYAYEPWHEPVYWGWGWRRAGWYGYYGYYFAPYPVYTAPAFWITDYLIAANLQAAYDARIAAEQAAAAQPAPAPPSDDQSGAPPEPTTTQVVLTPEVKQAIAEQVKAELQAERDAAAAQPAQPAPPEGVAQPAPAPEPGTTSEAPQASPSDEQVPDALKPAVRTFIVSATLSEQTPDGAECSLTSGDVLTRIADTPDANDAVTVLVSAGQQNDCAPGTQLHVLLSDLEDMHNHFREQIDDGLGKLATSAGTNGMPASPSADARPTPDGQAQPDQSAVNELQQQQQTATATEADVKSASKPE